MKSGWLIAALSCSLLMVSYDNEASAEILFVDDFGDGNAQDGTPASWLFQGPAGSTLDVVDQNLVVNVDGTTGVETASFSTAEGVSLFDTSIRTQFRLTGGGRAGVNGRGLNATITSDGMANFFGRTKLPTGIDPLNEDVVFQLDVIGPTANLWVWRAGDPMPSTPFATTAGGRAAGPVALAVAADAGSTVSAEFRYVAVADMSIPEPAAAMLLAVGGLGLISFRNRS